MSVALRRVAERVHVSIATGREPADVIRYAGQLGLTSPQISDNGALILDPQTRQSLWSEPLGRANASRVLAAIQAEGYAFIATHPEGSVTRAAEIGGLELTRVSALDLEEPLADRLVAQMRVSGELNVVKVALPYNGMWAVDFTRVGVDKGTAARALASMLGIEPGQMAAVGDSYNDLPMLRAAGLAIAMADAPEELKAVADHVCPSAEQDGLATAIDEFVLPAMDR